MITAQDFTNSDCDAKTQDVSEVLLTPNSKRFVLFPIQYNEIWAYYKKAESLFWTAEEIKFDDDMKDWNAFSDNERHFIKYVLAFFASADGIVAENLAQRFYSEVQIPEARCFYGFQLMIESVHSECYSLMIDTYVKDKNERADLFHAIETIPAVKAMADWSIEWMDSDKSFAERLVAFAVVEGIFFSGPFCALNWLKKRGKMPGLTFSNELISRDEGLHTDFACLLYLMLAHKISQMNIEAIVKPAVAIQIKFICDALPVALIGMDSTSMREYIEFVAGPGSPGHPAVHQPVRVDGGSVVARQDQFLREEGV